MQPYLVHVQRIETPWNVVVPDSTRPGRNRDIRVYTYDVPRAASLHEEQWVALETFYCADKTTAEDMAKKLSKLTPGSSILICALTDVVQCIPGESVISTYSDKGLLPK